MYIQLESVKNSTVNITHLYPRGAERLHQADSLIKAAE